MPIPHSVVTQSNLALKGKWMFEPEDFKSMIKMVEDGVMELVKTLG